MTEQLERYRWFIVAIFAVPLLVGVAFLLSNRLRAPEPIQINTGNPPGSDIRVYISGAVQRPGVYPLKDGDRWISALEAAGGAAPDADLTAINLARRARDEDQIVVPRVGQVAAAGVSQAPLVNINTASEADLQMLPGIGQVRAHNIVQSRATVGPFAAIDDLLSRKLVPESVYADIAPLINVAP